MPPKIRRPAAAGKAALLPARGLRKRPAARAEEREEAEEDPIKAADITVAQCRDLGDILVMKGSYWEAEVQAVLRVKEVYIRQGGLYLKSEVLGTQNESLLRMASTRPGREVQAHLCPADCTGGPHAEGVIHVHLFRKLGAAREPWMSNMLPEDTRGGPRREEGDDLNELRADMERMRVPGTEGQGEAAGGPPPVKVSEDEGRKKKKRKDKRSRSRRRPRKEWKVEGQKELALLFKNTGIDPNPSVRKRFRRKAAKLARRKLRESKGSSSTSSSSTEEQVGGDATLFGSSSKVQVIGRRLPGALTASALEEAAESLITQEGGLWETREGPLPAIFVRYFRAQMGGKMAPAMAREALTLSHALDLLLRGRPADVADLLSQRIKALELQSSGVHYTVSQQQELLPREASSISTTPELHEPPG